MNSKLSDILPETSGVPQRSMFGLLADQMGEDKKTKQRCIQGVGESLEIRLAIFLYSSSPRNTSTTNFTPTPHFDTFVNEGKCQ